MTFSQMNRAFKSGSDFQSMKKIFKYIFSPVSNQTAICQCVNPTCGQAMIKKNSIILKIHAMTD